VQVSGWSYRRIEGSSVIIRCKVRYRSCRACAPGASGGLPRR
jgi:hypothetical protein